jgi:putative ABC transport system permease protein
MSSFIQDLRYGTRTLLQRPAFTAIAVLTLARGIGATTAIFSVVDAVLLKPLPFPEPNRLVMLWESNERRNLPFMNVAPPNFADWRERSRSFDRMGAWREQAYTLAGPAGAEQVFGAAMSHDLFDVLGVGPMLGRTFTAEEDSPGGARVAVISYGIPAPHRDRSRLRSWKHAHRARHAARNQGLKFEV